MKPEQDSALAYLSSLKPLSQMLNTASDAFTARLKSIEEKLNGLALGIEVMVNAPLVEGKLEETYSDRDHDGAIEDRYRDNQYLAYGRAAGGWHIMVRTMRDYEYRAGGKLSPCTVMLNSIPLVDATRNVRIAAADMIDSLLFQLGDEARQKVQQLTWASVRSRAQHL